MNDFLATWSNRAQYYLHNWRIFAQNLILKIALVLIYFIGIGLTFFLAPLFGRKFLKIFKVKKGQSSYWVDAQGYEQDDIERFNEQV